MLKNKNDGSYWICGEGIGTEQKTVSGELIIWLHAAVNLCRMDFRSKIIKNFALKETILKCEVLEVKNE